MTFTFLQFQVQDPAGVAEQRTDFSSQGEGLTPRLASNDTSFQMGVIKHVFGVKKFEAKFRHHELQLGCLVLEMLSCHVMVQSLSKFCRSSVIWRHCLSSVLAEKITRFSLNILLNSKVEEPHLILSRCVGTLCSASRISWTSLTEGLPCWVLSFVFVNHLTVAQAFVAQLVQLVQPETQVTQMEGLRKCSFVNEECT